MSKENIEIAEILDLLENGQYKDKMEYMKELHASGTHSVTIGHFTYQKDVWCWIVWKATDNPEYKGEPLCKVVPRNIDADKIGVVLDAQAWMYI